MFCLCACPLLSGLFVRGLRYFHLLGADSDVCMRDMYLCVHETLLGFGLVWMTKRAANVACCQRARSAASDGKARRMELGSGKAQPNRELHT